MSSESLWQVTHSRVDVDHFHTSLFGVVFVTYSDFHDVSERWTSSMHQILCESWKKLNKPLGTKAWVVRRCFDGMPGSRPVAHQLLMTNTRRPTSCTTPETAARFQELLCQDRRRTIHNIAEEVGIGYGTCQRVLMEELGMHHVAA